MSLYNDLLELSDNNKLLLSNLLLESARNSDNYSMLTDTNNICRDEIRYIKDVANIYIYKSNNNDVIVELYCDYIDKDFDVMTASIYFRVSHIDIVHNKSTLSICVC